MSVSLWYDGTAVLCPQTYNGASRQNLKRGNTKTVGRWSRTAQRTFISRCAYLMENSTKPLWTLCLTYRNDTDHAESKRHINTFAQYLRRKDCQGYAYTVEFQERKKSGLPPALHYHWIVSADFIPVYNLNETWARIRGDYAGNAVRDVRTIRSVKNAAKYAAKVAKYASKAADMQAHGVVPSDVRLWATTQNLVGKEKISITDENLRILLLSKADKVESKVTQEGYEYTICDLSRRNVRDIYDMNAALIERDRRTIEKQKREILRKQEKRRQMDAFQPTF